MIFATALCAFFKGRSVILWSLGTFMFGWPVAIVLAFIPASQAGQAKVRELITPYAVNKAIKEEIKDVNTVEDLFKQLENK